MYPMHIPNMVLKNDPSSTVVEELVSGSLEVAVEQDSGSLARLPKNSRMSIPRSDWVIFCDSFCVIANICLSTTVGIS